MNIHVLSEIRTRDPSNQAATGIGVKGINNINLVIF